MLSISCNTCPRTCCSLQASRSFAGPIIAQCWACAWHGIAHCQQVAAAALQHSSVILGWSMLPIVSSTTLLLQIKYAAEPDDAASGDADSDNGSDAESEAVTDDGAARDASSICRVNKDCLKLLRRIAEACLLIDPERRPLACDVQALLFEFIAEHEWTNSLSDHCQW